MNIDLTALGKIIKERRIEKKLNQTELAKLAEVSQGYITGIENAKIPNPTILTISKIANALDIYEDELWMAISPEMKEKILAEDQKVKISGVAEQAVPYMILTPEDMKLLEVVKQMSASEKKEAETFLNYLLAKRNAKDEQSAASGE